jgi:hypothetical protein|tara:strand:- start:4 stop:492 length:489 start_codon:yes stop_codon:yes gene_type:complete
MGFAGANAALGAPCVSAACPYELFDQLPAAALEAAPPPLRVLLVSGVADVDVPAWMSLKLAAKAWAAPRSPHPLHLLLVPGADHYLVAGLADTMADAAAAEQWASVCAALRAFVDEDDGRLAPLCGGWLQVASWSRHSSAARAGRPPQMGPPGIGLRYATRS